MNTTETTPTMQDATNPVWLLNRYASDCAASIESGMQARRQFMERLAQVMTARKSRSRDQDEALLNEKIKKEENWIHRLDTLETILPELAVLDAEIIKLRQKRRALTLSVDCPFNPFSI